MLPSASRFLVISAFLLAAHALHFDSGSSSDSCEDDSSSGGGGGGGHHHPGHGGGDSNRGCPNGWKRFERPSGGWCIRVFAGTNEEFTDAASSCINSNAALSGIQNPAEMTYIHETASSILASSTGSLWIGAKRTAACVGSKLTATCSKTTSFYWTDGSTTGTAGFSWLDGSQPDNALGGQQNCIAFFFAPGNTTVKGVNWYPGALDDINCSPSAVSSIPQRRIQGFVCGRAASSR